MEIDRYKQELILHGERGDSFIVTYTNMGEPYRTGLSVEVNDANAVKRINLFIETSEAIQLRDLLNKLYPVTK